MAQYIDKSVLEAEIEKRKNFNETFNAYSRLDECNAILSLIDTLEVKEVDNFLTPFISFKDMVNIQYPSVNDGIKAHAEIYSFNIESELINQLTPEQQKLWRKDIEQAYISGGDAGVELARDLRYKENLEVKEVDLEKEYKVFVEEDPVYNKLVNGIVGKAIAKHFFELGLKAQKGE